LHSTVVDTRRHAIAVELDLVDPLRPRWRLLDGLGELERDETREGNIFTRPTGFDGPRDGMLDDIAS
jgi:hypothetical protein